MKNNFLKDNFLMIVLSIFFLATLTLWFSHQINNHMILATEAAVTISAITGLLAYYAIEDLYLSTILFLIAYPSAFFTAILFDKGRGAAWHISNINFETTGATITAVIVGAMTGIGILFIISTKINDYIHRRKYKNTKTSK